LIREFSEKISILSISRFGPKSEKWTEHDEIQALLVNEAEEEAFRQNDADETRVQVLKKPGRKAQLLSWMWVFPGGPTGRKSVIFRYETERSPTVPKEILSDYTGWIHTDDYGTYETALKELNDDQPHGRIIRRILCLQHARRRFQKARQVSRSENSKEAIKIIRIIFTLEDLL
jgi:hypothetical protein